MERCRGGFVGEPKSKEGEWNETAYVSARGDRCAHSLRDNAPAPGDANLSGRSIHSGDAAVSAPATAPADGMPGRDQRPCRYSLPGPAAASAATSASAAARPRRRTRLSLKGRRTLRRPKLGS